MNNIFNKKTAKKVGDRDRKNMDTRRPYIWIPDVDRLGWRKVMRGLKKVGVMGLMIFAAVWAVLPANGAEAAFSCDK